MATISNRLAVVLMSGLLAVAGCSSSGGKRAPEAAKATDSITVVATDLGKGQEQVDKVLAAIDQLQAGGDLAAAFADYTGAVADVEASGKRVAARREAMQANREAYIEKWQKDLESIENPDVRAALADRKQKVAANFDTIRSSTDKVRDDYQPFLKNLQEIRTALALDLNSAGVAALRTPLDKARADGQSLKVSIAELQAKLTEIAGSMSPSVGK